MQAGEFSKADKLGRIIEATGPAVVLSDHSSQRNIAMGLQIASGRAWFRLRPQSS
jgi:hypothetical protein